MSIGVNAEGGECVRVGQPIHMHPNICNLVSAEWKENEENGESMKMMHTSITVFRP